MTPDQMRRMRLRRMNLLMAYASFASTKAAAAFTPLDLFAAGEIGVWYDPSDMSTLFQDAAGTTPVTAGEQPVGLVLDKSRGLAETQLYTTDFSASTGWTTLTNATISGGALNLSASATATQVSAPPVSGALYRVTYTITTINAGSGGIRCYVGSTGAGVLRTTTGTFTEYIFASGAAAIYFFTGAAFVSGSIDNLTVTRIAGSHASQTTAASRPVLRARYNQFVGTATLATQNVTTVAADYTLRFEGTGSITLSGTGSGTYSAGSHTVTCTAGTLTATVTGTVTNADIRVANDGAGLPVYQRVDSGTSGSSTAAGTLTYDTTGFPFYVAFDGTDDALSTASIDFSSTAQMSVFAGVRKIAGATAACVIELSSSVNTNTGAFAIFSSGTQAGDWDFAANGTALNSRSFRTYNPPITNVLAASYTTNAANNSEAVQVKIDGSIPTSTAGNSAVSTGNFGNYPLYIGSRAGSSLRLNARFYSLIVLGRTATAAEITATEAWVNSKTGAY